ncbi:MAG: polysaccharide deacetylase family protein [Myxococcales bacterium]|nr:polysaccharide deacetylase family protein [Myxococcales bacterium]
MSTRWWVKKTARHAVAVGSFVSGAVGARSLVATGPRVRVLTYHRIGHEAREPFCVTPDGFEAQMRFLSERRLATDLDGIRAFVAGRAPLPDGACLVTIDDGCVSTLTEALPILRRWGVPAVAFVSSNLVGLDAKRLPERYLRWEELREVADSGFIEIGSHAHSHVSLGALAPDEAAEEARKSKALLEEHLGREVRSFAYPFGTYKDFDAVTERALADAGYTIAFNSMHGVVRAGMDPISLPRIKIEGGEGLMMFRMLSGGGMDAWRVVDRNLWRLQRVRQEIRG